MFKLGLAVHALVIYPPAILFSKTRVGINFKKMHAVAAAIAPSRPSDSITVLFVDFFDRMDRLDFDRGMQGISFNPGQGVGDFVASVADLGYFTADDGPVAGRQRNIFPATVNDSETGAPTLEIIRDRGCSRPVISHPVTRPKNDKATKRCPPRRIFVGRYFPT